MATSFSTVFFVQRDGKMFSQIVGPGSVIKVADLENAKPEKSSYWVLKSMQKSQMYPLMEHLGITSEGNPGSKQNCIKKIIAKWPLPPPEISDQENLVPEISDNETGASGASEVEGISDFVDRAFAECDPVASSFYQPFDGGLQTSDMNQGANEIQDVSDAVVGESSDESYLKFLICGQDGWGKRARASGDVGALESDPVIVQQLLGGFSRVWTKDDWKNVMTDLSMEVSTLVKMKEIMSARGGTPDAKAVSLLRQVGSYVKIKVRV